MSNAEPQNDDDNQIFIISLKGRLDLVLRTKYPTSTFADRGPMLETMLKEINEHLAQHHGYRGEPIR